MEITILIFQILILFCIGGIIFFRKYLFSYASEKGKNIATKEDVAEITKKVEEVKIQYASEVEHLKMSLSILSKKHSILFDEKIRVFKKLQKTLVDFKKYCEAALGSYRDDGNEFHPTLDCLDTNIPQATLQHITLLHEIKQEDFIFLSNRSKKALKKLHDNCMIMCSMELTLYTNIDDEMIRNSVVPVYESAIGRIDTCLQCLYEELEFPEKGE
ncbi:MAG: hypothetical protein PHI79_06375 [Sulfurovaceae bacterium]|nr:hypothetical protein [Sulfurovaceae bacterium]MDD5549203.1 hypothetical protein [Sulfurovaceae bacterium]